MRSTTTTVYVFSAVFVLLVAAAFSQASSFIGIDDTFFGAKSVRTVLPDGRIHVALPTLENSPFTADQLKQLVKKKEDISLLEEAEQDDSHHISVRGQIIMKAEKEEGVFKLDTNSHCDINKLVCHDKGDKNMRMSLFSVSEKLISWLQDSTKMQHITLAVDGNHFCHGDPIFRKVTEVKFVETVADSNAPGGKKYNGGEVLLITSKASYEEIFDEADVELDLKHKDLTHMSSADETSVFDSDSSNDHGVVDLDGDEDTEQNVPVAKNKGTAASSKVAASLDRFYESQSMSKQDAYKETFAGVEGAMVEKNKNAKGLFEGREISELEEQKRVARTQGWFKKAFKKIKKAVKKVVKKVRKTVKRVANRFVRSVARGIRSVARAIRNLFTINVNMNKNIGFKKSWRYTKQLRSVKFTFYFYFGAGFTFKLNIKTNRLYLFHASVYGRLKFSASAKLPRTSKSSSGQTTLTEIRGPTIKFMIWVIPVWIKTSFPILAGYELGVSYAASAGFGISASCRYGVEYTRSRGFKPVATRSFSKSHSFKYSFRLDATPWIGAQARFALYSLITGYAYLQVGLDLTLTQSSYCNLIKLTGNLFVRLSAGLDIELSIKSIKIFEKNYGPWRLFTKSWPVLNVCKRKKGRKALLLENAAATTSSEVANRAATALDVDFPAAHAMQSDATQESWDESAFHDSAYLQFRGATAQAEGDSDNAATTIIEAEDSGKTWTTEIECKKTTGHQYDITYNFGITGFFDTDNNQTILYLVIDRNFTNFNDNGTMTYVITTSSSLAWFNESVKLGTNVRATLIEPTAENAEALGLDIDDLQDLSENVTIDENITALPIDYLDITFSSSNLEDVAFSNPLLCGSQGYGSKVNVVNIPSNVTVPPPPPEGSFFGRMFAAFGTSLFPAFIRLVTDVLVVVLVLALLIIVISWKGLPKVIGVEHFPTKPVSPRTREYIYLAVGMSVATLCFIWFIVGSNLNFAEIVGASMDENCTKPPQQANESVLVADCVRTREWKFFGAQVTKRNCMQYSPCSPDCRDICETASFPSWTAVDSKWPWCPRDDDSVVLTGSGGCTMFAFDAVINAVFAFLFVFVGCPIAIFKFDNIYRRLPGLVACLLLAGMFLALIWRRVHSFMKETEVKLFDPLGDMVIPFDLEINSDAERCWSGACITFFVMSGIIGVLSMIEMYLFHMDVLEDRITRFDESFESADASSAYKKAKSASEIPQEHEEGSGGVSKNNRARTESQVFREQVAADLEGKEMNLSFTLNNADESNFKSQM